MSFKENLQKKIKVDQMTQRVLASIGVSDGSRKVDKPAVRWMLELAGCIHQQVRDLDLYMTPQTAAAGRGKILVLDNELKVYDTTLDDVALRKSPIVKEMLNIRNAIKILNDKDVAVSRKEATVQNLRGECIATLDLTFGPEDLAAIALDGKTALDKEQADGVIECIDLFAELLAYRPPPRALRIEGYRIVCARAQGVGGQIKYGPLVVYDLRNNSLKLVQMQIGVSDKSKIDTFEQIAAGQEKADLEGSRVFDFLKDHVGAYPRES